MPWDVHRVETGVAGDAGSDLVEERDPAHRQIEPEHRDLLLDLAVAAEDGRARAAGGPIGDRRTSAAATCPNASSTNG